MQNEAFKIYVDQLRDGEVEKIVETLPPDFLDVKDEELEFSEPVNIKGEVYVANDNLLLHLDITTVATMPCSICNEKTEVGIELHNFYHMEPLVDIKTGIFNFQNVVREAILLDVPQFAECSGSCPRRKEIKKFMRDPSKDGSADYEEYYHPFADLDLQKSEKKQKKDRN